MRVDGKPRNRLVAKGLAASFCAMVSRQERNARAQRAAEAREQAEIRRRARERSRADRLVLDAEEALVLEVIEWSDVMAGAALRAAGFRKRKGEWRRPREVSMGETESRAAGYVDEILGGRPPAGVEVKGGLAAVGEEDHAQGNGESHRRGLEAHFAKAWAGEESVLPAVRRMFKEYELVPIGADDDSSPARPFLDKMIDLHGGNPVGRAEKALIGRLTNSSNQGLYTEEALRRTLAKFKADLLGDSPTAIERVMVDSIGCCWLDAWEAEERGGKATTGSATKLDYLERRKERSTRRLLRGLKALDMVRRKLPPGLAVQVNFQPGGRGIGIESDGVDGATLRIVGTGGEELTPGDAG